MQFPQVRQVSRRKSLSDEVYETMYAMLMEGIIPPEQYISIDGIARRLEVSPTPVREALVRLEADGLVMKQATKGLMSVPLLDRAGFANLFEMRQIIEPPASALSALKIQAPALAELEASIANMQSNVDASLAHADLASYREFVAEDENFHRIIAKESGNPHLMEAVIRLRPQMHLYRLAFEPVFLDETIEEHIEIFTAIRQGNVDDARAAMSAHIQRSNCRIDNFLSSDQHRDKESPDV